MFFYQSCNDESGAGATDLISHLQILADDGVFRALDDGGQPGASLVREAGFCNVMVGNDDLRTLKWIEREWNVETFMTASLPVSVRLRRISKSETKSPRRTREAGHRSLPAEFYRGGRLRRSLNVGAGSVSLGIPKTRIADALLITMLRLESTTVTPSLKQFNMALGRGSVLTSD